MKYLLTSTQVLQNLYGQLGVHRIETFYAEEWFGINNVRRTVVPCIPWTFTYLPMTLRCFAKPGPDVRCFRGRPSRPVWFGFSFGRRSHEMIICQVRRSSVRLSCCRGKRQSNNAHRTSCCRRYRHVESKVKLLSNRTL